MSGQSAEASALIKPGRYSFDDGVSGTGSTHGGGTPYFAAALGQLGHVSGQGAEASFPSVTIDVGQLGHVPPAAPAMSGRVVWNGRSGQVCRISPARGCRNSFPSLFKA